MHETLVDRGESSLRQHHFADPIHGQIFDLLITLQFTGPADPEERAIALRKKVNAGGLLAAGGGDGYVDTLWMIRPSEMQAKLALACIRECWALRTLIDIGEEVTKVGQLALDAAFQKRDWRVGARAQADILATQLRHLLGKVEAARDGLPS